ncbi:MAG: ATP-binding protein [Bacteroidia bacterium]|nr:ATP-binding protein [Bacteroidia bacterium]
MSEVSNINNEVQSYTQLARLYELHQYDLFEIIPISIRGWFAANMAAALGSVLDKISKNINTFKFDHIENSVEDILRRNNFLSYYGYPSVHDKKHTTIQYQKLKPADGKFFNYYVTRELLARTELPEMSPALKEKMVEAIYEIFVNAQIHSETEHIYTCGQFYPNKNKIEFTIADTGIGFKERINRRFNKNLNSIQAIRWAVRDRHTTKRNVSGGIGLALLRDFIHHNKGKLQIVSSNGFYQYDDFGEKAVIMEASFPGTVVNLQFCTNDPVSYLLAEENDLNNIF